MAWRDPITKDVLETPRSRGDPGSFTGDRTSDLWITTYPLLNALLKCTGISPGILSILSDYLPSQVIKMFM
ncbi:hypothetical protein DPMN_146013, partial [Dreissena polymorpha]